MTTTVASACRYEPLFELGRGGMGAVLLARATGDAGFERLVVMKRMLVDGADETATRRFLDEARLAASVLDAHVIGVQQVGCDATGPFLVLDYVEGDSLEGLVQRATLRGETLPDAVVLRIVLDGLAGLSAVHECCDAAGEPRGILHRDVSTANLLVGRDGLTRLGDFGIAWAPTRIAATSPGLLVGKPPYMAPEYVREHRLDTRVDLYAMGMTLWVALARREPWPGKPLDELLTAVAAGSIPRLEAVRPDLDPEIAAFVRRALAFEPDDRFASARAMREALATIAARTGVASHAEVGEVVQRLAGRDVDARRRLAAAVARSHAGEREDERADDPTFPVRPMVRVAVVLAVVGAAWTIPLRSRPTKAPPEPPHDVAEAKPPAPEPRSDTPSPAASAPTRSPPRPRPPRRLEARGAHVQEVDLTNPYR